MDKEKNLLEKARKYAFLLLKFRLRSEEEIRQRLKNKKFALQIIEETLSFLKDKAFVDDNHFARAWIESRIKRPLGIRRLKQELQIKGIDKEIIESQINEIKKNYPEEDVVTRIIKEKLEKTKGSDPQKAKRRIYAYLLRRGFSPGIILEAMSQL